jgi:two-component system, sensor histidine kinase YesM
MARMKLTSAGKNARGMRANSIRSTLKRTNIVIVLATLVPFLISTLYYNITLSQYARIIENIYDANSLSSRLQSEIYLAMWNVVSGKTDFEDGTQYALLDRIKGGLDGLERNADSEDDSYLIPVARNALATVAGYVDKIGLNISERRPVRDNEKILGEISSVSDLLYDVLQKFVAAETEIAHIQNVRIQRSLVLMTIFQSALFASILVFLLRNYRQLNRSVKDPIYRLKTMASKIAQGDLSIRVDKPEISELDELTDSLNSMAGKLDELIEQNIQKQRNLQKAEMRALQAQIAPHFMYNTLDTILALAEDGQNANVVATTLALSSFFRLSLSNGRDWVSVAEEKSHVESYLAIQKMRYGAILEYEIDFAPDILEDYMVKILLQPLVENAIYHGIKKTRRPGSIKLRGVRRDGDLVFTVEDNGLGMSEADLARLRESLLRYDVSSPEKGFGLYNVFKRIQLYYEIDNGLTMESEYNKGSKVTLRLPAFKAPPPAQAALSAGG